MAAAVRYRSCATRRRASALLAVVLVLGASAAARAQTDEDAAIRRGLTLRRAGKDDEALREFQAAYAARKSTRALAQVALAEQALGRWPDAEYHLTQALSDRDDRWIRKNEVPLHRALQTIQTHLGSLDVTGPPGAEIIIDGLVVGTLPLRRPVRLPIGVINVEVRQPGALSTTRSVTIQPGVLARETVWLQPAPPTPSTSPPAAAPTSRIPAPAATVATADATPPATDPSPSTAEAPATAAESDQSAPAATEGSWKRPVAWAAAGTAALAAGIGVGALILRNGKVTDASNLGCSVSGTAVTASDPANTSRCVDLENSSSRLGVTAVVSFSAAAAMAIASAILFATEPSSSASAAASASRGRSLACAPTLTELGAACALRF